ncbi:family 16 glycoside hydrolase [Pelatocladus sp. BLCC-F211]|uniref:family 16 glycoside hydrolase n=1 Tax=Pelatocladus sp. BLCC-F211 TaxID=3342752 RepID=UPI0035BA3B08
MTLNRLVDSGQPLPTPDVQRTTFSLDAVARFVCNTWEEILAAQSESQFDAIVIGSGMYGAYTATKLFEFGRRTANPDQAPRVLVLESGPFLISEHVQNLTRVGDIGSLVQENLVDPGQVQGSSFVQHHRCIGGKSLFWGGWTPRLLDTDVEKVDADGANLWPDDVREYLFRKAQPDGSVFDGYEFIEREIGAYPVQDFINGSLYDALFKSGKDIIEKRRVPSLKAVVPPPIAVQGESPVSGLFSIDKFSSLPLLLDSIREAKEKPDQSSKLFLVPYAEVIKLETVNGIVTQVVIALLDPSAPKDKSKARVVRLNLKPSAIVIIAGNTINSTRLALNSFPRPPQLAPGGELMGRNLMSHVRGNFVWRVSRNSLGLSATDTTLRTAALHVQGSTQTSQGPGQFHFQFYAAPNVNTGAFRGAANNPEEFLYRMVPNLDDVQSILEAQEGLGDRVVIGIRTCGETFGDRTSPIGSNNNVSWMSVNPFGGNGDDVYFENGQPLRIPKAFVNLVETPDDKAVRVAQAQAAFAFIEALANQPPGSASSGDPNAPIHFFSGGEDPSGTTYHESGTLWMGTDYTKSVTDANGRFHHVSNAYCVDQSIFPTVGSANPVPTGLTLSRKIARSIIERYTSQDVSSEGGFETLYRGNFKADGWEIVGSGSQNFFDVQNQSVPVLGTGVGNKNVGLGVLWFTQKKFKNFILKLEWKAFDIEANSGIFLRMPEPKVLDDSFYHSSTEIQIDERGYDFANNIYGSPLHKTGAVYEVFAAQRWAAKVLSPRNSGNPGYWNSYEIRVEGNEIEVKLNNQLVSAGTFSELLNFADPSNGKKKRSEGFIGLQCHTEVVQFRNIRIKEL